MNAFWIGKVNSRRGPAELSYIRPQELIQEVLEMNQFLDSGFAQPLTTPCPHDLSAPTGAPLITIFHSRYDQSTPIVRLCAMISYV